LFLHVLDSIASSSNQDVRDATPQDMTATVAQAQDIGTMRGILSPPGSGGAEAALVSMGAALRRAEVSNRW